MNHEFHVNKAEAHPMFAINTSDNTAEKNDSKENIDISNLRKNNNANMEPFTHVDYVKNNNKIDSQQVTDNFIEEIRAKMKNFNTFQEP